MSVSGPRPYLARNGFAVRVANAGSVDVPTGVQVHLARGGVAQEVTTTSRILRPGEWEDVSFSFITPVPSGAQWTAWTDTTELIGLGILDSHAANNSVKWRN